MRYTSLNALAVASIVAASMVSGVSAQAAGSRDYHLPSQGLGQSLRQIALESREQIVVSTELVAGLRAPQLEGKYTVDEAIDALLAGLNLRAERVGNTIVIQRAGNGQDRAESEKAEETILVTGSRIRGRKPVGVPVITLGREEIARGGFATTQQVVQSIPQNFGGGANEGTSGLLSAAGNGNSSRGSGINLRGLGQNSTLLLINGDRPPLGGVAGTFADLSVIPASIIDRIEIVPDGSSAIYGSDAVAGVVNVVTRQNFRGVETGARFGTADGDAQEYQLSQLVGTSWTSGHVLLAYGGMTSLSKRRRSLSNRRIAPAPQATPALERRSARAPVLDAESRFRG